MREGTMDNVSCSGPQGVPEGETRVTCTACAGTLLLEFGILSRLTGKPVFEQKARAAVVALFGTCPATVPFL